MTEAEAQALINEGAGIDAAAAQYSEAAATGQLDGNGGVIAPDPDAGAMGWIIVPEMLAWAITTVFPETQKHYTDAAKMNLARAIAPVAEKYGWEGAGEQPELMLVVAVAGFAAPAYMARRERIAEAAKQAEAARIGAGDGSRE